MAKMLELKVTGLNRKRPHEWLKQQMNPVQYYDIERLSTLAQEKSYTMPRGLTREQRREWARKNQQEQSSQLALG